MTTLKSAFWLVLIFSSVYLGANPFLIEFPPKEDLDFADYFTVQQLLREKNIKPLLTELYPEGKNYTTFNDFAGRISRGINQVMISFQNRLFPETKLEKFGEGGNNCFVCCIPFGYQYTQLLDSMIAALHQTEFNGHFLYRKGGFPNPTGKEIQYAGVPYCFKIFMMLEAYKLGFNNVIWVDAALIPLQNPAPLFDHIDEYGALLRTWQCPKDAWRFIFPFTRQLLIDEFGVDVLKEKYVNTIVFGLNMDLPNSKHFVDLYYHCVKMGTPFLSCLPEEFVITALMAKINCKPWFTHYPYLVTGPKKQTDGTEKPEHKNAYFMQRKH